MFVVVACAMQLACEKNPPTILQQIKERGEIHFITRNSPTTYYEGVSGPTGFEYDLMKRFANRLGVKLKIKQPEQFSEIIPKLALGEVDIAAAGLTVTDKRRKRIRFGPPYQQITQEVIYRAGKDKPQDISDLIGKKIEVIKGSSHLAHLMYLQKHFPDLSWKVVAGLESEELIAKVWKGEIDITIADSNELAINQGIYPEIRSAFSITSPESLAWGIAPRADRSLDDEVSAFFNEIRADGTIIQLLERYYSHTESFNYTEAKILQKHVRSRLLYYLPFFKQASAKFNIDWRLLAAIGYQESHWRRRAISPTGVRGVMMLTLAAASHVGVSNRLDAKQSIMGGADYFSRMVQKIPEDIPFPDRTWMALAAYNIGLGHLNDVRIITQKRNMNADKWVDVKENLPLLIRKKWYKKTKYGYARGNEAKRYVENVRRYFDQLIHIFPEAREGPVAKEKIHQEVFEVSVPAL